MADLKAEERRHFCCYRRLENKCAHAVDSHDGLEVVVHQNHVSRLLAHVGARLAHRHADVGGLQSHGVVHAVTRHGHHGADVLEGLQGNDKQTDTWRAFTAGSSMFRSVERIGLTTQGNISHVAVSWSQQQYKLTI